MLSFEQIQEFCDAHNYDLRVSGNGRWIDQKCTPDVIWSISDFILDYVDNVEQEFNASKIWHSDYAKATIAETYSKPDTDEISAENEYDKVFSQPLCMLCYAGVIKDISPSKRHKYVIENREVLEYIARNDVYALRFLYCYIEKVLKDSGLFTAFQSFFDNQDNNHFKVMKDTFIDFYHTYTAIKKEYEPRRIFTKVLNPLAFKYNKKGAEGGSMSSNIIIKSDMMYNQDNFRDVYRDKPKGVSRQEWLAQNPDIDRRDGYFEQMMSRSKRVLRDIIVTNRNGLSELTQFIDEQTDTQLATQIHHIFPKSEFPDIRHYLENLIALTPNQHYGYAHPNNNTQMIDIAAQKVLLIAKTYSIQENIRNADEETIYEFAKLLTVLSVGWDDNTVLEISDGDFIDVLHAITYHYVA